MRKAFAFVAAMSVLIGIACGTSGKDEAITAPAVTGTTPELRIATFDAREPGWGDAPVSVHLTWAIVSTSGRPLTCLLDLDGDGSIDKKIDGCKANTLADPIDGLPAHTYSTPGAHRPKLVVSDGVNTVDATQEIYANKVTFAKNVIWPEKTPGFVKAEAVPNTSVVLTFASEGEVPAVKVGDILWGTSGNGYLIKATEVTKAGATISIKGVQGKIGEAIENGFVGARNVGPSYDQVQCLDEYCQGFTIEKITSVPAPTPAAEPGIAPQSLGLRRDPLELSGTAGVKLSLPTGGAPIDHSIFFGFRFRKFVLDVSWFTVKTLEIDVTGGVQYDIALKGQLAERKIPLGTFTLGSYPIGPVVVVPIVFPTLTLGMSLKMGVSLGFDFPTHLKYTPETGVELEINPDRKGMLTDVLEPLGAGASWEAEARLSFPVKTLLWGIAGPYIGPHLGLGGELKLSPKPFNDDPCEKSWELCGAAKVFFGGEYGIGCPWIEEIDVKQEITAAEIEIFKRCLDRKERDPACQDAGADGGDPGPGDAGADVDADAGTPACVPTGTVSGPPTGSLSGSAHCAGAEVFWGGSNLGTTSCWTIGDQTFSSVPGNGQRAILPTSLPPGAYTLSVQAPGGTITAPITITAGEPPNATSISPASGAPGTAMTVSGTGLTGFTNVTVSGTGGPPSASVPVTSNNGTMLTFDVPNLPPGSYKVDLFKASCGHDSINFMITAPTSTLSACWQAAGGNYAPVSSGCGLPNYIVIVNPSSVSVGPFGTNGTVVFSDPGGVTLQATGLDIFGAPNHTCQLTCATGQIVTSCTNPQGGSCSQPMNKQ